MLKDVVAVEVLEPYRLRLTFEDGVAGEVDLARLVGFEGVFAPLRDPASFRAVRVEPGGRHDRVAERRRPRPGRALRRGDRRAGRSETRRAASFLSGDCRSTPSMSIEGTL